MSNFFCEMIKASRIFQSHRSLKTEPWAFLTRAFEFVFLNPFFLTYIHLYSCDCVHKVGDYYWDDYIGLLLG